MVAFLVTFHFKTTNMYQVPTSVLDVSKYVISQLLHSFLLLRCQCILKICSACFYHHLFFIFVALGEAQAKVNVYEKELSSAQKTIAKSKKAQEVQQILKNNESLQHKLLSQEEEFRLQNQTLLEELTKVGQFFIILFWFYIIVMSREHLKDDEVY